MLQRCASDGRRVSARPTVGGGSVAVKGGRGAGWGSATHSVNTAKVSHHANEVKVRKSVPWPFRPCSLCICPLIVPMP